MEQTQAIWIKDPLAILADGAERGIVVQDGRIVELVPKGGQPSDCGGVLRGRRPCGPAGADQHPSSFLPDADPGAAGGDGPRAVSVAAGALSGMGAADAGSPRPRRHRGDVGAAAVRLHHHDRSSLCLSGRARGRRRYRSRRRQAARRARAADPRLDEPVAARRRLAARQRGAGRGYHPRRQRTRRRANIISAARMPWCRSRWRHVRRFR